MKVTLKIVDGACIATILGCCYTDMVQKHTKQQHCFHNLHKFNIETHTPSSQHFLAPLRKGSTPSHALFGQAFEKSFCQGELFLLPRNIKKPLLVSRKLNSFCQGTLKATPFCQEFWLLVHSQCTAFSLLSRHAMLLSRGFL